MARRWSGFVRWFEQSSGLFVVGVFIFVDNAVIGRPFVVGVAVLRRLDEIQRCVMAAWTTPLQRRPRCNSINLVFHSTSPKKRDRGEVQTKQELRYVLSIYRLPRIAVHHCCCARHHVQSLANHPDCLF